MLSTDEGTHFASLGCRGSCREAFGCTPSEAARTAGSSASKGIKDILKPFKELTLDAPEWARACGAAG